MRMRRILVEGLAIALLAIFCGTAGPARAQAPAPATNAGPIQPWGLPPRPPGAGPVEKFAATSTTPPTTFLQHSPSHPQANLWVYQYSTDGSLRKIMDGPQFPNGIAISPDNNPLAIGDCTAGRMLYAAFAAGPTMGVPGGYTDPQRLTFVGVKAGTYFPGNGCPDGIHYDVKGNLWAAAPRLGGILQIDPPTIIPPFVPVPNANLPTPHFPFLAPA